MPMLQDYEAVCLSLVRTQSTALPRLPFVYFKPPVRSKNE